MQGKLFPCITLEMQQIKNYFKCLIKGKDFQRIY